MPETILELLDRLHAENPAPDVTTRDYQPGQGRVVFAGWKERETGSREFVVEIVFDSGPPDLPASVVWQGTAVTITESE